MRSLTFPFWESSKGKIYPSFRVQKTCRPLLDAWRNIMEARKRAVEPQQLHTSNKQPRVVESAPACKSIWSVFDDDDEQLLPGSFPLLPHLPLRDEFAAFREACAERAQLGEQEKAVEDARAAAFDNDVGRNEWAPQFQRKPKPAKVDGEIFCAPKKDGSDGRRYEPAAADTAAAETAAEAEIKCKGASPLTAKEAVAAAEAQGLELVKSSRSATGFYGVSKTRTGKFEAQIREAGKNRSLGTYKTAEEAALIRAQHIGPEQVAALQERAVALEKERAIRAQHIGPEQVAALQERAVALEKERAVALELTAKEAVAAAEAKGLELVKSSRNATGFHGVCETRFGTFEAQIREAGKKRFLGTYKTAEEAAVIIAQHIGHEQVAALQERAVALEKPPLTAKEAIAAAEAKGLELVKSSRSATGFCGVFEKRSGMFEAQISEAGKNLSLGTYKTAEEAALIIAQHTGHEQGAARAAGARAGERTLTAR